MSYKVSLIGFILAIVCLCFTIRLSAQVTEIDTSEYLPLIYEGALEYNLTVAASLGYNSEVERLIKAGAEVDVENTQGATPLYFAVINKKAAVVQTLINNGANVNKVSYLNETPLFLSLFIRDLNIAEILIRAGAEVDYQNRTGVSPLHYSAIYGLFSFVDLLLYYEADIDIRDNDGTTPLMAAIWAGYPEIADLLIQHGANMEARDNEGFTPFLIAAQNGDTLIINLLHKKGVDIYEKNIYNWNALNLTIKSNHFHAADLLMRIGNKWAEKEREVVSPYKIAAKYRRKEIISLLEKENFPGKYQPEFDRINISLSSKLSFKDFYSGISLSFLEPLSNIGLITGLDTKLWYTKVLSKEADDLYYQYLDKSTVVYAGAYKDFQLTDHLFRGNFYFSTSLSAGYSFGNKLKGTEIAPENKLKILPSALIKWVKNNFCIYTGLEYMNSDFYKIGPVWARAGCAFTFHFDLDKAPAKIIKWY